MSSSGAAAGGAERPPHLRSGGVHARTTPGSRVALALRAQRKRLLSRGPGAGGSGFRRTAIVALALLLLLALIALLFLGLSAVIAVVGGFLGWPARKPHVHLSPGVHTAGEVQFQEFVVSRYRPTSRELSLPEPHGFGAPVMASVFRNVTEFISGGLSVDWDKLAATADDEHYHGRDVGLHPETRQPLWKPTPFDFSKETEAMKRVAHTKSCFNKRKSNALPLHRPIPDVRARACKTQWQYKKSALPGSDLARFGKKASRGKDALDDDEVLILPDTSVVFVQYNEPLSPLLRSIYSVLDRSPAQLLREIIVVDDGSDSDAPWLAPGGEFEKHIEMLPKVKLIRLRGRNGLMRARNVGIAVATAETVTILDSHIEVNVGWLEPLMGRIAEGRAEGIHRVVVPAIDSVDADNFAYTAGGIDILGHSWTLGQVGVYRPKAVVSADPVPSPIMAGGLLSLERAWFNELGYYDPLMRLWGGEETEISFRIWQCGGSLECVPCSRVGHIFRSDKHWQGQVYKVPGEEVTRNKLRTAAIWMDHYAELVQLSSAPLPKGMELGSLDYMKAIRDRLHCKPYSWYLNNIYPEILPSADRLMGTLHGKDELRAKGFLRSPGLSACVDTLMRKNAGEPIGAYPCHYQHGTQSLVAAADGSIVVAELAFSSCLQRTRGFAHSNESQPVVNGNCEGKEGLQKWVSIPATTGSRAGWIYEKESEHGTNTPKGCLTVVQTPEANGKSPLSLRTMACAAGNTNQLWEWETVGNHTIFRAPKK